MQANWLGGGGGGGESFYMKRECIVFMLLNNRDMYQISFQQEKPLLMSC